MKLVKRFRLMIIYILIYSLSIAAQDAELLTSYVNPFIGTAGWGAAFPGAVVPWGMVSVSPHTSFSSSGYIHGRKYFYGFGHVHLSGTGCPDLGGIIFTASRGELKFDPDEYRCTYGSEKAFPGFYSVALNEPQVQVELTASERCGFSKFTPLQDGEVNILLDAGKSLNITAGGRIKIISDTEIEGYNISGGFCGEINRQTTYFYAKFNQPFSSSGIWINNIPVNLTEAEILDTSIGCWMKFNLTEKNPLLVKVGVSYVSEKNAKENMEREINNWDFNLVRNNAEQMWEENLSRILVEGGSEEEKIKFYTAMYHILIHPSLISDVNGEYPLMGRNGIGRYEGRNRYTVFSLWDTYRTLHPFLTLIYPERQSEMVQTMVDMYSESGFLPKWELTGAETYMMVGDPAPAVISDSYIKGIRDFDVETALEAMLKPALIKDGEQAHPIRAGYHELLAYGYIPFEQDRSTDWWVWGPASTSLEYNLSDWTIARFAEKLGKKSIADEFYKRSLLYRNLFDPETQFIRPRLKNGEWMEPFDPLEVQGSGDWSYSGGPGYVEGNAWNYTWFVPHDIPGLINLFGGEKPFAEKLYESFLNKQFTITNEPDIAYPYLFNYIKGEEFRTRELVQKIIKEDFKTGADGLPGNDDCGTISAWLVFSMLGFYPDCPASDYYQLGIPAFSKAVIKLSEKYYSGKELIIERNGNNPIGAFEWNERKLDGFRITHEEFTKGGTLNYKSSK